MIQAFQKFSQSRVAKVFLAIVALSFIAFFGGGDWFRPHDRNAVVAQVGELAIGRYEFADKVQKRAQILMSQAGESFTREQLLDSGLPYMVLNQLIDQILLDLDATALGLTASDDAVRNRIHEMQPFQDESGVFSRALFVRLLRANGISEESFIAEIRQELIREQLVKAIQVGAYLPGEIVSRLFEAQFQNRQASLLMVKPKSMPLPAKPTDAELEAFYKENKKIFKTPELRTFSALILDPAEIAKNLPVDDEEIQATYDAKPDAFGNKPLKEVRELVIRDVQKEKAQERIYDLSQELEDNIAGGATFAELAEKNPNVKLLTITSASRKGLGANGTPVATLPKNKDLAKELLQTAFTLDEGTDSPFAQSTDEISFAVFVDKITPSAFQPFAEIKDRILKIWTEKQQFDAARTKAENYTSAFNKGDRKASLMTLLPNLSLAQESPSVSNDVKALVFSLRPGQAGVVPTPEGFAVVVLNKVIPPSDTAREEKMEEFSKRLLDQYKEDLLSAYLNALRLRYPVSINQAAIKALFS